MHADAVSPQELVAAAREAAERLAGRWHDVVDWSHSGRPKEGEAVNSYTLLDEHALILIVVEFFIFILWLVNFGFPTV